MLDIRRKKNELTHELFAEVDMMQVAPAKQITLVDAEPFGLPHGHLIAPDGEPITESMHHCTIAPLHQSSINGSTITTEH